MKQVKLLTLFCFILLIISQIQAKEVHSDINVQIIPDEAIRLRILANSDTEEDQEIKRLVRDRVNAEISSWVQHIDQIQKARDLIAARVPDIELIVQETLQELNSSQSYHVEYRSNVTFPAKLYDNIVYPAGEYEAVLITLGDGMGANWWCVLFPPLCFLDFNNGATVAEVDETHVEEEVGNDPEDESSFLDELQVEEEVDEEVEVKFFIFEWFGWS